MVTNGKSQNVQPRFSLGQLVSTPGAIEAMEKVGQNPHQLVRRHQSGDWGEVSPDDAQENELSIVLGFRLMSVYTMSDGTKVWVITEADRAVTTILLPSEY